MEDEPPCRPGRPFQVPPTFHASGLTLPSCLYNRSTFCYTLIVKAWLIALLRNRGFCRSLLLEAEAPHKLSWYLRRLGTRNGFTSCTWFSVGRVGGGPEGSGRARGLLSEDRGRTMWTRNSDPGVPCCRVLGPDIAPMSSNSVALR